jgi:predicted nucleic acid-binding Zn ribbon protein
MFEILYRWGYNPQLPEEINHPESAAIPTIAALTGFNIFSLIIIFRMIFFRENELLPMKYAVFIGLGLFTLLYFLYHYAFVSGGKCRKIKLNKERKVKRIENIILTTYIILSLGLLVILPLIGRALNFK